MPRQAMPEKMFRASSSNTSILNLHMGAFPDAKELHERATMYHPGTWLTACILPPFQRPVVWDEARMVRFVESAWLGLHLGTYVWNDAMDAPMDGARFHRTDRWLIDGRQRLTALDRYFHDAFEVFGKRWTELPDFDRRDFLKTAFASAVTKMTEEEDLRLLYDRLNFGGVAHEDSQRALPGTP